VLLFKLKFNQKNNLYLVNVDISASTEAFLETVCLIAVRRSVSGRTDCRCLPHLRQPVRPETERRMAIRQTVSRKASVEAETSTLTK